MDKDIQKCLEVLQSGGLILYPTDTIWGIGCDATNPEAVSKVYALKNREDSKALVVLVDGDGRLMNHVQDVPEVAWDIIEMSEKPTTIIYDKAKGFAPNVIAEDGSIAIRLTSDTFCKKLIQRFKKPLVSTSANISGDPSPAHFGEVSQTIISGVDFVVNHRQEERKATAASSIIKLGSGGQVKVIRP